MEAVQNIGRSPNGPTGLPAGSAIRLLGEVGLHRDGRLIQPRTRKARALLAYLALTPGGTSRERLAGLLWGDRGEEQARASVRQALYELRALLGTDLLSANGDPVTLQSSVASDIAAITTLAAAGDDAALAQALGRTTLEPLRGLDDISDSFDHWLRDARAMLVEDLSCQVRAAAARQQGAGDRDAARRFALHALRLDPFDERAMRIALRADAALGDQGGLHRRYRDFSSRLAAELDTVPAADTAALYTELRNGGGASPVASTIPTPRSPTATVLAKPRGRSKPRGRFVVAALVLALAVIVAGFLATQVRLAPRPTPLIAVLPFENLSPAPNQYFASGVAEEIQNLLGRAPGVAVLGRASADQFRRDGDVVAAARRLHVTHLLDGSVRSETDRVRVIVRLVRTKDGAQLWSERYDRHLGDVLAVQADIADAVMSRFTVATFPRARVVMPQPAVYDRYLAARSLMRDRRAVSLALAESSLREAIARQPRYAPAHALLAQVLMLEARHPVSYGSLPYDRALAEATREAELAAALDPALGEAQAALGLLTYSNAKSISFYARAVALDPQRADFHRWYGQSLMAVGRFDMALGEFRRAVAIDPLWGLNSEHLIAALADLGRPAEAATVARQFAALSRDDLARVEVALAETWTGGHHAEGYRLAARIAALAPEERRGHYLLASALAGLGEPAAAVRALVADDDLGRVALVGSRASLAAAATRLDARYWDSAANSWGVNDRLVNEGHAAVLLRLFDAAFASGVRFRRGEIIDAFEVAPIIIALREARRDTDAAAILGRLERQQKSEARLRPQRPFLLAQRAVVASLAGDRDRALALLMQVAAREPYKLLRLPFRNVSDQPALRSLAADPRMKAVDRTVRGYVDRERRKLGWPPLDKQGASLGSI